MINKHMH